MDLMSLKLEFSGGTETLFNMQKELHIKVPTKSGPILIVDLLQFIYDNLMVGNPRANLFVENGGKNIRSGILVLVNEVDWELLQGPKTILKQGDVISFISTLHGG
ncbi:unnamed protein product [Thelazia callipaeda]|uniref:Ubiquitin-related modifier 1 homolog n=1 Tax=Thelazia callipaeda TaxID=103827 RepID=A0A0N5CLZ7_THECL|nr:unnamed protein product [Thelazia callipaeda]